MLQVLVLAPWLGWVAGFAGAAPAIVVEPLELTGRAVENKGLFRQEVDQAVAAAGGLAEASGASLALRVRVNESSRDYTIHLEVVDAKGAIVSQADSSCDICSESEAAAQTGRELATLLSKTSPSAASTARFTSQPPGATVVLDGAAIGVTPLTVEVTPGPHAVSFDRGGYESAARNFEAAGTEPSELHVDLVATRTGPRGDRRNAARIGGAVGVGVGLALVVTGIALIVVDENEIKNDCSGANVDPAGHCRYRRDTLGGGVAATVVGFAVAGTGAGFLIWSRPKKSDSQLRAKLGPTRASLTFRF